MTNKTITNLEVETYKHAVQTIIHSNGGSMSCLFSNLSQLMDLAQSTPLKEDHFVLERVKHE